MRATTLPQAHSPSPRPVEKWQPTLGADALARIAGLLREVQPMEAILDDIGDVLGNQEPREEEFDEVAERLRGDLMRLIRIALAAEDTDAAVSDLIQRARMLRSEDLPGDCRKAVGHLRRMAQVANGLMERLAETGSVKEVL